MQVRHHTKLSQQQDSVTDTRCARYETVQTGWSRAAAGARRRRPRRLRSSLTSLCTSLLCH